MKRRSLRVLLGTGVALALLPLFNLFVAPVKAGCCHAEKLFNMDFLLKGVSTVLYRLGISVDPAQVVVGREGWLFVGDRFEMSVTRNRTTGGVGDVQTGMAYAQGAQRWDTYLRGKGVNHFQIMVAPNKESIYPEYLPGWAAPRTPGITDNLFQGAGSTLFLDLRPALRTAKKGEHVAQFYRHDTHWNHLGASRGFRTFADRMHKELPEVRWPDDARYLRLYVRPHAGGDLADFLRLGASVKDDEPVLDAAAWPTDLNFNWYGSDERVDPMRTTDSRVELSRPLQAHNPHALNQRRVLWLTDSFGNHLAPMMRASFSDVVQLHWRDALRNGGSLIRLVDEWKPDFVFVTVVERSFRGPAFASFLGYAPAAPLAPSERTGSVAQFEVTGMSGLVRDEKERSFRVTSEYPSLTLSVSEAVAVSAALSLKLTCLDGAASVPVQVFWKSSDDPRFHGDRSMRFLHVGSLTAFDIQRPSEPQRPVHVKDLRLDLRGQGHCRHFRLDGLDHAYVDREGAGRTGR